MVGRVLRALIRGYRVTLSAIFGRQCRYLPTCSEYGEEAIHRHGAWVGGWLTFARICRCHPFGPAGFDPVPDVPPEARSRPWAYARWTGRHMDPATRLDR